MGAAIFNNRLDAVEDESKPRGPEGRPLPISIEAAPELWHTEPIFIVVNLPVAHPEVGEQDDIRAEPPSNRAEQPDVFGARDVEQ